MAEFLEDAKGRAVVDTDAALTDEQLLAGGLAPVQAFVRTKQGKAALRAQRHKEKQEALGVRQVNVMAPEEAQEPIKQIAARTKAGEPLEVVLRDLAGVAPQPQAVPAQQPQRPQLSQADRHLLEVVHRGGFKARLIRLLAG